jgi:hypothetical protein
MNEYFEGAIRQLQARARHLVNLIPQNLECDVIHRQSAAYTLGY